VRSEEKGFIPLVTIASREMSAGSDLAQNFNDSYASAIPQIRPTGTGQTTVDGLNAQVMKYDRPWGEPWYSFQDTWVVVKRKIFVISCQTSLNPTPEDMQGCQAVLDSLHFSGGADQTPPPAPTQAAEALPPGGCPQNLGKNCLLPTMTSRLRI